MSALTGATLADVGVDAVALKPTEVDVRRARRLSVETLTIDYEGSEHVPEPVGLVAVAGNPAYLDALGPYAGRRPDVRQRLPPGTPTDSSTTGSAREALLDGLEQYALAGNVEAISGQVDRLHGAGVDHVVAYPARGLGPFLD